MAKFKVSKYGQWEYPGENTIIPSGDITMQGVPYPVLGIDNLGNTKIMQPGGNYQFPGNMVYEIPMAYGGDISIPDLSRPNWLDKAQKGQQIKYYDDLQEFKKANQSYNKAYQEYLQNANAWNSLPDRYRMSTYDAAVALVRENEKAYGWEREDYPWVGQEAKKIKAIDLPIKPAYKEKPKEYIPTKTVKLEREPIQLVMPQSDRTLMPYNNTMQVLRSIQQEDRDKQGPRVVPAPDFRYGGWLDKYQGDEQPSQVPANLPWLGNKGQILTEQEQEEKLLDKKFGIGPTVDKAKAVKAKENLRKTKRIETPLPSGAITPVMGPVEYALMAPVAGASAMRAAPIIGSALNAPIAGVSGATVGNALGALGATDAIVNRLPEIPGQVSRGEYMDAAVNAATGALDLYGANMVSPLFKGIRGAKQLPGSSNSSSVRSDISNFRDIENATREFGATDDEAIAAIEAIRSRKLSSWKTEEGRRRLQKLIDKDPRSSSLKNPFKNETPDTFIKRMENLVNSNVRLKNIKEEIPKLREQIIGYHKNMDEIDEAFNAKRISADDYFNMQKDLDEKIQRLGSKHDELYIETEPSSIAFIESTDSGQRVFLNPDLLSSADLAPTAAHEIAGHSLSNFTKYTRPTYLDEKLSGLKLKNPTDKTIDAITTFKPKGESNLFYHANYPGSLADNQNYWLSGSSGTERVPFVTELKEDMFTKGIIKNDYDVITPEMIQQHYNTYASKAGEKYPLRVYDIMEEDPKNFNLLSEVLNDLPSYAAPLTIGAGTAAALRKEKDGGWLDKYQVGAEVNCEDGNCRETDEIQAIYDQAQRIPERVVDFERGVAEQLWTDPKTGKEKKFLTINSGNPSDDARNIWKQHGAPDYFPSPSCMYVAGLGWRCAPETKEYMSNFDPLPFNSNTGFINAVNKSGLPFKRAAETDDPYFDAQQKGKLRPGDVVNFKGPDVSHAMTFIGYDDKGRSDWFHSNGMPNMVALENNLWEDLRKPGVKKYVNRFDEDRYVKETYGDKIEQLEKQARENPTYYKKRGGIATDNQDYNYIKYKDLSLSKGTGWLDNYK